MLVFKEANGAGDEAGRPGESYTCARAEQFKACQQSRLLFTLSYPEPLVGPRAKLQHPGALRSLKLADLLQGFAASVLQQSGQISFP